MRTAENPYRFSLGTDRLMGGFARGQVFITARL